MKIQIGQVSKGDFSAGDIRAMHRLRHEVFRERLKWDVRCEDDSELDEFDEMDPIYMIVKNSDGKLFGCWRLLPTEGPYMMKDTFPQTLCGQSAPQHPHVWELSRFALSRHEGAVNRFCDTVMQMIEKVVTYAVENNISRFVTVTTVGIERLMRVVGVPMSRFGVPIQVGIEKTVALSLDVSEDLLEKLRDRRAGSMMAGKLQA